MTSTRIGSSIWSGCLAREQPASGASSAAAAMAAMAAMARDICITASWTSRSGRMRRDVDAHRLGRDLGELARGRAALRRAVVARDDGLVVIARAVLPRGQAGRGLEPLQP